MHKWSLESQPPPQKKPYSYFNIITLKQSKTQIWLSDKLRKSPSDQVETACRSGPGCAIVLTPVLGNILSSQETHDYT